jgi:transposase-like protein
MKIEVPDGADHFEVEKAFILKLLEEHGHNVSKVSRISKRSRSAIHRWIHQWGLERKLVPKAAPVPPEPPAPAPAPTAARLAPETPPVANATRDLLTPEVRAKLDAMKAAKPKRPDEPNT